MAVDTRQWLNKWLRFISLCCAYIFCLDSLKTLVRPGTIEHILHHTDHTPT
jgi:hypothetical protein